MALNPSLADIPICGPDPQGGGGINCSIFGGYPKDSGPGGPKGFCDPGGGPNGGGPNGGAGDPGGGPN